MAETGPKLYEKARLRIPGGTQLLSKRPEMLLPDHWPAYYSRAQGAEVWDLDGRKYTDMSYSGIGSCVLGYADADVNEAVVAAVHAGSMSTLNCPEEVELADLLCELHPWAEMVRYARGGGEAMTIAVRIARTHTLREKIAFCGYHGWHDWYLAANLSAQGALDAHLLPGLEPAGVPRGLAGTAIPFHYNRLDELQNIVSKFRSELAAIVMEPIRSQEPDPDFLESVRGLAEESGAVLIFDEITAGFRLNTGGAHLRYGVTPDIAVFAKAISNGYPMAAIIGKGAVMRAAQESFISSTYWTERIGPAAALATIRKHKRCDVPKWLDHAGRRVQEGWSAAACRAELPIAVSGISPLGHFEFKVKNGQAVRTLFTQMMLDRGFLASNTFYAMYAHEDRQIDAYLRSVAEVFEALAMAIEKNEVNKLLHGPVAHTGFYRLT
ncbi:MAG: aminotransferase class III-fold pyridoxal phosphate-dependent enzyme [Terriglobia bacterium]